MTTARRPSAAGVPVPGPAAAAGRGAAAARHRGLRRVRGVGPAPYAGRGRRPVAVRRRLRSRRPARLGPPAPGAGVEPSRPGGPGLLPQRRPPRLGRPRGRDRRRHQPLPRPRSRADRQCGEHRAGVRPGALRGKLVRRLARHRGAPASAIRHGQRGLDRRPDDRPRARLAHRGGRRRPPPPRFQRRQRRLARDRRDPEEWLRRPPRPGSHAVRDRSRGLVPGKLEHRRGPSIRHRAGVRPRRLGRARRGRGRRGRRPR